jgi:hypothetical protein
VDRRRRGWSSCPAASTQPNPALNTHLLRAPVHDIGRLGCVERQVVEALLGPLAQLLGVVKERDEIQRVRAPAGEDVVLVLEHGRLPEVGPLLAVSVAPFTPRAGEWLGSELS